MCVVETCWNTQVNSNYLLLEIPKTLTLPSSWRTARYVAGQYHMFSWTKARNMVLDNFHVVGWLKNLNMCYLRLKKNKESHFCWFNTRIFVRLPPRFCWLKSFVCLTNEHWNHSFCCCWTLRFKSKAQRMGCVGKHLCRCVTHSPKLL